MTTPLTGLSSQWRERAKEVAAGISHWMGNPDKNEARDKQGAILLLDAARKVLDAALGGSPASLERQEQETARQNDRRGLIAEATSLLERSGLPDDCEFDGTGTIFAGRAHVAYISNHQSGERGRHVTRFYAAAPRLVRLLAAMATPPLPAREGLQTKKDTRVDEGQPRRIEPTGSTASTD